MNPPEPPLRMGLHADQLLSQSGSHYQLPDAHVPTDISASNYPHSSVILRKLGLKYGIRKSSSKYGTVGIN